MFDTGIPLIDAVGSEEKKGAGKNKYNNDRLDPKCMCKAVDKGMVLTNIQLEEKKGGKSGNFKRS